METLFVITWCAILLYGSLLMLSDTFLKIYLGVEKKKYQACENEDEQRTLFFRALMGKAELLRREGLDFIKEIKQIESRQGSYYRCFTLVCDLRRSLRYKQFICIESRSIAFSLKRLKLGVLKDIKLRWRLRFFCFRWNSLCCFTKYILLRCLIFRHSPSLIFFREVPIWIPL